MQTSSEAGALPPLRGNNDPAADDDGADDPLLPLLGELRAQVRATAAAGGAMIEMSTSAPLAGQATASTGGRPGSASGRRAGPKSSANIVRKPLVLPCGHAFCKPCITE